MEYTTIPKIATDLGLSQSKVHYLIRKLGIKPFEYAGPVGLYRSQVLEAVKCELEFLRKYDKR